MIIEIRLQPQRYYYTNADKITLKSRITDTLNGVGVCTDILPLPTRVRVLIHINPQTTDDAVSNMVAITIALKKVFKKKRIYYVALLSISDYSGYY